ncbi:GDYXXLXY domain-containing protein [Paludisphaera soli]|uniref:GDYXXLXY domain-containing protein n=1 Tax=Paludisphaera soli TaxID=2712865 RepID=UPI0013ED1AB0|nr:GDYXXLXY domain-containing protein [Paludisphaera soli]
MSLPESKPAAVADPDFAAAPLAGKPVGPILTRESTMLILAALFQAVVLGWMIVSMTLMFRTAHTVLVKVEPVDPRDLLRGEYVILAYEFSRVPPEGVEGLAGPLNYDNYETWHGRPVYVPLVPIEGEPGRYRGGRPTTEPPGGGGPFLQGTLDDANRIEFGIESYYVQEGTGAKYEEAARDRNLWAEVALTGQGWGTLRSLKIE